MLAAKASKILRFAGGVLWCLVLAGGEPAVAADYGSEVGTSTATSVVDGDTLVLNSGATVRLAGIEAPRRLPGQPVGPGSQSSRLAVRQLETLAAGKKLTVRFAGEPDRYGRLPGVVRLPDGRSLQEALLDLGLARIRGGEIGCLPPLRSLESAARKARRGMWADAEFAVREADDPSLSTQKVYIGWSKAG